MRTPTDPHSTAFSRRSSRTFAAALGTVIVSGALLTPGLATPAFAASACPVGSAAIAVGSSTCEIVFTANGTWTPPAGVSRVEALLVGGGGGSDGNYGGGGGEVTIVELADTGAVTIVVGSGGVVISELAANGGVSSVTQGTLVHSAVGGGAPTNTLGGTGGRANAGNGDATAVGTGSGGGAGGPATIGFAGAGTVVSTLNSTPAFPLFATDTSCFGGGGGAGSYNGTAPTATCGGGYYTDLVPNTTNDGSGWTEGTGRVAQHLPVANSGGGASPVVTFASGPYGSEPASGAAGRVVLRFIVAAAPEATVPPVAPAAPPVLAVTGAPQSTLGLLAAALLALIGGGAIAASRRGRTRRS